MAKRLGEPKPDNQDVAGLESRILVGGDGLDIRDADLECREGRIIYSFGFGVAFEVDEDSSAGYTTAFVPVLSLACFLCGRGGDLRSRVGSSGLPISRLSIVGLVPLYTSPEGKRGT